MKRAAPELAGDAWSREMAAADQERRSLVRQVAIHEAGHAVMMILVGAGVDRIRLNPVLFRARAEGRGTAEVGDPGLEDAALGYTWPRCLEQMTDTAFAAGHAAELESGLRPTLRLHESERREIFTRLRRARRWRIEQAVTVARCELRECWSAVESVADRLEQHGDLSGAEATDLILAGVPEWRRRLIPETERAAVFDPELTPGNLPGQRTVLDGELGRSPAPACRRSRRSFPEAAGADAPLPELTVPAAAPRSGGGR